jgi:serine phosphatase RsbU (regulator of sigma subunit)
VSGDRHVVAFHPSGVLTGVVDGIGHGDEAEAAAKAAAEILERYSSEPVASLIQRCHGALAKTRGVVMTLAAIHPLEDTISWAGVGNVEILLARADPKATPGRESGLLRNGLVGYHIPPLQASVLALAPGDVVLFATDGIRADFADGLNLGESPRQISERILEKRFKGTDDALVLAIRYLGGCRG